MNGDVIANEYFEWMYNMVSNTRYHSRVSYRRLLMKLHATEFRYIIMYDGNRAEDGMELRHRFAQEAGYNDVSIYLNGPCSILEMLIALSIRCEDNIMEDTDIGNRTSQWFWSMINNLGLRSMTDKRFDKDYTEMVIKRFIKREYKSNGEGGLFLVEDSPEDLRTVEIWYQMCWYLNSIL